MRANTFAADFLIPKQQNDDVRSVRSEADVLVLAPELDISPGIVSGRYQHLTEKWHFY